MNHVVHIQDWGEHILVTPTYDLPSFRKFVGATLWMASPQYLPQMKTWSFSGLYRSIIRKAIRRFIVCEECAERRDGVCEKWGDYILEEYAKATGITFGRKRVTRSMRDAAAILGIQGDPTVETVQRAFRTAVLKAHPDLGGSAEAVQRVIEARDALMQGLAGE